MVGAETSRPMGPARSSPYIPKRNLGRFRAYTYTCMHHMFWAQTVLSGLLLPGFGDEPPSSVPSEEDSADDGEGPAAKQTEKARLWVRAAQEEKDNGDAFFTDVTELAVRRYRSRSKRYLCVRESPSHLSAVCGSMTPRQTVRGMPVTILNKPEAPLGLSLSLPKTYTSLKANRLGYGFRPSKDMPVRLIP